MTKPDETRDPCCMALRGSLYQRGAAIEIDERRKSGTCCRETGKPSPYSRKHSTFSFQPHFESEDQLSVDCQECDL